MQTSTLPKKKEQLLTYLFLQAPTHSAVCSITLAKELQDVVLQVKLKRSLDSCFLCLYIPQHSETPESDIPQCDTASDELLIRCTHLCAGEGTGQSAFLVKDLLLQQR